MEGLEPPSTTMSGKPSTPPSGLAGDVKARAGRTTGRRPDGAEGAERLQPVSAEEA